MIMNSRTQAQAANAVNASALVTFPAILDRRWVALLVDASVSAGAALLEVVSIDTANGNAETVHWSTIVTAAAPARLPFGSCGGLRGLPHQDLVVRISAAGATNTGRINVLACGE